MGKQRSEIGGLILDTGALIAIERGEQRIRALLRLVLEQGLALSLPAGALAQAWRGAAGGTHRPVGQGP